MLQHKNKSVYHNVSIQLQANLTGFVVEMEDIMVCIPEISQVIPPLFLLVFALVYLCYMGKEKTIRSWCGVSVLNVLQTVSDNIHLGWTGVKFKTNLKGSNVEMEDFMVCIPEISLHYGPWSLPQSTTVHQLKAIKVMKNGLIVNKQLFWLYFSTYLRWPD